MKKYKKSHPKIINLEYQLRHRMKSLNYLMDHILYQIFKSTLMIYLNKIEKRIMFKIKTGYYT